MDPLSISASVVALFTITAQLINAVDAIAYSVKTHKMVLRNMIQELTALRLVLEKLEGVTDSSAAKSPEDEALVLVLDGCLETYEAIGEELRAIEASLTKGSLKKMYMQMSFTSKVQKLEPLRQQLERFKATLSLALHVRNVETSPNDLRREILDLRSDLSKFNTTRDKDASRLSSIQQYLMATSTMVVRRKVTSQEISSDGTPEAGDAVHDSQHLVADSATTLAPTPSTLSQGGLDIQNKDKLETFKSFKDWLSSFAPKEEEQDASDIQKNLETLRSANPELSTSCIPDAEAASISVDIHGDRKPNLFARAERARLFDADSFEGNPSTGGLSRGLRPVRLFVTGLKVPGASDLVTEEISMKPDAQVYQLLKVLHDRGYTDICGFTCGESAPIGTITGHDSALPILVTSGQSNYSIESGLRINQDESLACFYDNLIIADQACKSRDTFSIRRQLDGLIVEDDWVNRSLDRVPDLAISFDRTLRVPEDGQIYHLPANLGTFPLLRVEHFRRNLPPDMSQRGGLFLPMFQREAMLICFRHDQSGQDEEEATYAIRVFAGSVDAVSGALAASDEKLILAKNQDYVVVPQQGRLDGFCSAKGIVKQFVAMPLGFKYTAESQVCGKEFIGGFQLQIAPRFKGNGHFSLKGHQKDCGSLRQPEIITPDGLDRYKTPRELNLAPGQRMFVEGKELEELSKLLTVDPVCLESLSDKRLHPRCGSKCRPTFIHELYMLSKSRLSSQPNVLELAPVLPLSILVKKVEKREGLWPGPVVSVMQFYSPFLDVNDFKAQLFEEHETAPSCIKFNGHEHDDSPKYYDPIDNYHLDGGTVSFSPLWLTLSMEDEDLTVNYKIIAEKIPPGTWSMGLAAGGGVYQEICRDVDPKQWNWAKSQFISVQILNSTIFESVTGIQAPPCPISVQDYVGARMPFYHIVHSGPIEGSPVLRGIRTVGHIDAQLEIPISVFMRDDAGPLGCAVCQKNLCDSILTPCRHVFCYGCVQKYMTKSGITCAACLKEPTEVIEFSAPMELPSRLETMYMDQSTKPGCLTDDAPVDSTAKCDDLDPESVTHWAKKLRLNPNSPVLAEFVKALFSIEQRPSTLEQAATSGDIERVGNLLTAKHSFDDAIAENGGRTAVQAAAENRHAEIVRLLLGVGASANEDPAPENGRTSLQAASGSGSLEIVEMLIAEGADLNAPPSRLNGRTALQAAAEAGNLDVVKILIRSGARLSDRCCQPPNFIKDHGNCFGRTALHFAAERGHEAVLRVLLGAISGQTTALVLHTLLPAAAISGDVGTVKLVLHRGAKTQDAANDRYSSLHEAAKGGHDAVVQLLIDAGANIEAKCHGDETALFLAAIYGHTGTVKLLMSKYKVFAPRDNPEQAKRSCMGLPEQYEPALHLSAERGSESAVRLLLQCGFDVDGNTKGVANTPLFMAAQSGHLAVIKMLVEAGADIHDQSSYQGNALHAAASEGNVAIAKYLLLSGIDPRARDGEENEALHLAAMAGNEAIVRLLLEHGADAIFESGRNESVLHMAARCGSESLTKLFLEKGLPANSQPSGYEQRTPLHEATLSGNDDVVRLLLDHGADHTILDCRDVSPLHLAVEQGSIAVVRRLLANGANPHRQTRTEFSLLGCLIRANKRPWEEENFMPADSEERRNIAELLLEHKVDIYRLDDRGLDVLYKAVECGNPMMVRLLLEHGANPQGGSTIHKAASSGHCEIAELLLQRGADPNAKSKIGFTPLQLAAMNGHTGMVHLLVRHGALLDEPGENGMSSLHWAAKNGRYAVAQMLLDFGAQVDLKTNFRTPLHFAEMSGHSEIVWLLIQHGCDRSILDGDGQSAWDLAIKGTNPAVVRVLERAGEIGS